MDGEVCSWQSGLECMPRRMQDVFAVLQCAWATLKVLLPRRKWVSLGRSLALHPKHAPKVEPRHVLVR